MTTRHLRMLALAGLTAPAGLTSAADFADPVRMEADGQIVQVEAPGYAAPCWGDVDGDGDKDLLVGQFRSGHIHVFHNTGDGTLTSAGLLQAGGETAVVPGVW